jgi:hypothetical protein
MRSLGADEPEHWSIRQARQMLESPEFWTPHPPCAGEVFAVCCPDGQSVEAVRKVDSDAVVDLWKRRYRGFKGCALMMIGALLAIALVAWMT